MITRKLAGATMVVVGVTLATPAMGQGFSGPYVSAGIGFKSSDFKLSETDGPTATGPGTTQTDSASAKAGGRSVFFGSIAAGWDWNPSGPFVLGFSLFADLGSSTVAETSGTTVTTGPGGTTVTPSSSEIKQKDRFGIYVEPGYEFTPRTVGYAKLGWNRSKYQFSDSDPTLPLSSFSATFNGFAYGVGLKHLMTDRLFVFVEWVQVDYGSKSSTVGTATTTIEPNNSLALIGAGWRF